MYEGPDNSSLTVEVGQSIFPYGKSISGFRKRRADVCYRAAAQPPAVGRRKCLELNLSLRLFLYSYFLHFLAVRIISSGFHRKDGDENPASVHDDNRPPGDLSDLLCTQWANGEIDIGK